MKDPQSILSELKEVELPWDRSAVPECCIAAFPHLKKACDLCTDIFLRQQNNYNNYEEVMKNGPAAKRAFYSAFLGPWNSLDAFRSVFSDEPERSVSMGLYPEDLSADELEQTAASLPKEEAGRLYSNYTVLKRGPSGALSAVDYHVEYAAELKELAAELARAARLIRNGAAESGRENSCIALADYLETRGAALISGDYRKADADWVRLRDIPLELVIGPYEVYFDRLAGVKASYEAMLFSVDRKAGEALHEVEKGLPGIAAAFPLPNGSKAALGGLAPIVVVDQLYAGGEARQGVMAAAFNLPNDPWVRGTVGWKQVMIRNVMKVKFETCAVPIARAVLGKSSASFDPFFSFVLFHEVSHGLGPAYRANGSDVASSIGASYTAVEEAKADTGSMHILLSLGGSHGVASYDARTILDNHVAGLFRSMRLGFADAHGAANLIQFNWAAEKGVFSWEKSGKLSADAGALAPATASLLEKLCEIESGSSAVDAAAFVKRYTAVSPELRSMIGKLESIPADIRAKFAI